MCKFNMFITAVFVLFLFCYIFRLSPNNHMTKTNKQNAVRATTAQLYPGRDTFDFDQGHMTKNQPITVFILLSESLAVEQYWLTINEIAAFAFVYSYNTGDDI